MSVMDGTEANLLILGSHLADDAFVRAAMIEAGWHLHMAGDEATALAMIESGRHDLMLVDCAMWSSEGFGAARALRARDCQIPILALVPPARDDLVAIATAAGMDGHLTSPVAVEVLLAALSFWRPGAPDPIRRRLAEAFGGEALGRLVAGFGRQLADALVLLDSDPETVRVAHRIAGLAGTLGFADVSASWLALSEGAPGMASPARLAARRALAAIARERRA